MKRKRKDSMQINCIYTTIVLCILLSIDHASAQNDLFDRESETVVCAALFTLEKPQSSKHSKVVVDGLFQSMFNMIHGGAESRKSSSSWQFENDFIRMDIPGFESTSTLFNDLYSEYLADYLVWNNQFWHPVTRDKEQSNPVLPQKKDFNLSLFMDFEYKGNFLDVSAVKLKTSWTGLVVTTIYHYNDKEFELGLSADKINALLPKDIRMEFKTVPQSGAAGVLFSIAI